MISLGYLLFIALIPITISIEPKIKFAFMNGYNMVRCGENQLQVYTAPGVDRGSFSDLITCDNKRDTFDSLLTGFLWDELNLICYSSSGEVHEIQMIQTSFSPIHALSILPDAEGELAGSIQPYKLYIANKDEYDYGKSFAIQSTFQPATRQYFQGENKMRTIYVHFPGHPVICRIQFFGEANKPCIAKETEEPLNPDYVCYYTPGAAVEPTANELERELRQASNVGTESESNTETKPNTEVLEIAKPVIPPTDLSNSVEKIIPNILPNNHPGKKKFNGASPSKGQKKSSVPKLVIIALGILLLFALIGGVAFHFISKNRSKQSSVAKPSSAVTIETGSHRGSAETSSDQSEAPSADDSNNKISTNDRTTKEKFTIERQTSGTKKRPGANITLNDDL